jgi:hypothetical protein
MLLSLLPSILVMALIAALVLLWLLLHKRSKPAPTIVCGSFRALKDRADKGRE